MRKVIAIALMVALVSADAVAQGRGGRGGGGGGAGAGGRGGGAPQLTPQQLDSIRTEVLAALQTSQMTPQQQAALRTQLLAALSAAPPTPAQPFVRTTPPTNPVIVNMWEEGWTNGQAGKLMHVLADSIGSRLTGSPGSESASAWVMKMYASWGIPARKANYGTTIGFRRGVNHIDLIEPRVRTLEGTMLSWSTGTGGKTIEGEAVVLPAATTPAQFAEWAPNAKGKWVMLNAPELSCRSPAQWEQFGLPETRTRITNAQRELDADYNQRVIAGGGQNMIQTRLKEAGAVGVLGNNWSNYPGIDKIFGSPRQVLPTFDISCEDYGLVHRLAAGNQHPKLRIFADAEILGEKPVWNTIGEIKGSEKPNEYIILSAHFDSWEGHSGVTDNGTGTITMMEAMRILKKTYPNPKRTILVGHWTGEEQGLIGSRSFVEDNPQIVAGVVAGFNQDNGTGRIQSISPGPFGGMDDIFSAYLTQLPMEITRHITVNRPSTAPGSGGSDHSSWQCMKAPVAGLGGLSWDYSNTTWHTNRDSYDKMVEDDLKNNATLVAMLAYMASEDPQTVPKYNPPAYNDAGQIVPWPTCPKANRAYR